MLNKYQSLIDFRRKILPFYSPYNFLREESIDSIIKIPLEKINNNIEQQHYYYTNVNNEDYLFIYDFLEWDSNFFQLKTYKLYTILFNENNQYLPEAIDNFIQHLSEAGFQYLFIEIPTEDICLIQGLGKAKFRLIETRLNYYHNQVQNFNFPERYGVRKATSNDILNLRHVASEMRNEYDRFHADKIFDQHIADNFLSEYVEQSIKGFSDVVLVPDEKGIASDSFLTANFNKNDWNNFNTAKPSKMVLSAVSAHTNKGWYIKLISEMMYAFKKEGCTHAYLNTQSTNRQVFHTWEKLGFKLGYTTHVFSLGNL